MTAISTNITKPSLDHSPLLRTVPGAKVAIIMVHGIASTPRHFDFLNSALPNGCSVHNLLLAGHGGTHRDFAKASMKQWKSQVEQTVSQLEKDHEVLIGVGFSLGCLLLMESAKAHPKLNKLILLNPPLRPRFPLSMGIRCTRYTLGRVRTDDLVDTATFQDIGCTLKPGPWRYLGWIPRFAELLILCRQCRKEVAQLPADCQAFLGKNDELVKLRTLGDLSRNPQINYRVFEGCTHCYYTPDFLQSVTTCLSQTLEELSV